MNIFKVSVFFVCLVFPTSVFAQKMKAEDVLAKHLESIGTADIRVSIKTQIVVGDALVKFISPRNTDVQGRIVLASAAEKNFLGMSLNAIEYPQEKFSFDGKNAKVGFIKDGFRSKLGNFVVANDLLLEESLLGGTLSTSWALLDVAAKKPKLSFDGTKKIDGKEVYVLGYSPKGGGDVDIKLYFDKETFRHVRTEYKRTSSAAIGLRPEQSSRFSESRLKITEDFSDFKAEKGLTLPHNYRLFYSTIGQNGTTEIEWNFNLTEFSFNQNLAPNTFVIEATN
ncbi:MAG: hypothetical protein H0X72_06255 [Acidobacteria bacterium]|jgi:hypothetical protein|nr:hypothetical protein [Acidobacteriota bacterium]MBA4122047.1 hypothetical protein [Acidobacteriota bacterium]